MKSRWMWAGIVALLLVLAGGGVYYTRSKPAAEPQRARDPGLELLFLIRTVEREPETQLSKEQIAKILPFVKALKDISPSDAEAITVIARAVTDAFTPAQKAALEEARKQFQERQRAQGAQAGGAPRAGGGQGFGGEGGGSGGPPGGRMGSGGGMSEEQRAQFRARAFDRMIRYLERRMK